ncbi:hypothetical protein [Microbacterium sp. NPDC056052]|uniref:hypothetical protein n=1 Tax=Microbacterium sp. NPDC056052 TaxID=3345695 RepID=UPI0035E2749B
MYREQLIEKAKANIERAASSATPSQAARIRAGESDDERLSLLAQLVALFEEANTPTDDERELIDALCKRARTDSTAHDLMREAANTLERFRTVQGGPSDAVVLAAVQAYKGQDVDEFTRRRIVASNWEMTCMRAALRAAATEGGER